MRIQAILLLFQHTAARRRLAGVGLTAAFDGWVSTHSRPKAAGHEIGSLANLSYMFQHTAARRRLALFVLISTSQKKFQHTAARRRLGRGFA